MTTARLSAKVVFPAPPFCEMKAMVRMDLSIHECRNADGKAPISVLSLSEAMLFGVLPLAGMAMQT